MNELVQKLTKEQEVEASLRPEATPEELKAAIDRDYVHVKFVNTRGGTELGFRPDPERSDTSSADFSEPSGEVTLVGTLILDYVRVRCHAKIDVATLKGKGYLEVLEEVQPGYHEAEAEATN